jgi:hypothetical protein
LAEARPGEPKGLLDALQGSMEKSFENLLAISRSSHHVQYIAGKDLGRRRLRDTLRSRLRRERDVTQIALLPHDDNKPGDGRCPACCAPTPIAPALSEYRGYGIIHHHWHCRGCNHEWITVLHAPV